VRSKSEGNLSVFRTWGKEWATIQREWGGGDKAEKEDRKSRLIGSTVNPKGRIQRASKYGSVGGEIWEDKTMSISVAGANL